MHAAHQTDFVALLLALALVVTARGQGTVSPVTGGQPDAAKAQTLVSMLWSAIHDGQKLASEVGYAGLSPAAVTKAEALVKQISAGGQPVMR